jgi:TonB family protein
VNDLFALLSHTRLVLLSVTVVLGIGNFSETVQAAQTNPADPPSDNEFRTQVAAIIQSYREGDAATGRRLIEQFRLPDPQEWFSEHLSLDQSADLARRYERLYENFAESLEHTVEAIVANRDAELVVGLENSKGETPAEVRRPGAKLSGMVSIKPASLLYGHFKITVKKADATSWADTFVHQDGAFRFMGFGAWPFWVWQDGTEGSAPKGGSFATPPILIARVNPAYPQEARSKKIEGVVALHVLIDKAGHVKNATVLSGDPILTQAALDAVSRWRYQPATLGGAPCESEATANINFSLH